MDNLEQNHQIKELMEEKDLEIMRLCNQIAPCCKDGECEDSCASCSQCTKEEIQMTPCCQEGECSA